MSRIAFLALVILANLALTIAASGCFTVSCFNAYPQLQFHKGGSK